MRKALQAVIDDPSPRGSVEAAIEVAPAPTPFLTVSRRDELLKMSEDYYDFEHGGWGNRNHFIDADSMDLDLALAENGDKQAEAAARQTFDAALALLDPVWGGVYQYSDSPDWSTPHFEKIISFQAQYLRQYSFAYARWRDPRYLDAARNIERYLTAFLKGSQGAFFVSQDADLDEKTDGHIFYHLDDAARRKLGAPRVDTHVYARENGWAISALVAFYAVTSDASALADAERAANAIIQDRSLPGGGFRHGDRDRGGPFLGDTLATTQALLDLYAATGAREWLKRAGAAGRFLGATFAEAGGGFLSTGPAEAKVGQLKRPVKLLEDQVAVARVLNLLHRYTGDETQGALAEKAMRYLVAASANLERPFPGLLLADAEYARQPTHLTIVGRKDDVEAISLHTAALAYPSLYKRVDWWDPREGELDNPDVAYPELKRAAAFACSDYLCSAPAFSSKELVASVDAMSKLHPQKPPPN
jgi:uncharacterized protein YyaL (SSP411 family)